MITGIAAAFLLFAVAASSWAGSIDLLGNSLDQLLNSASSTGTGSSSAFNANTPKPKPVTKLSVNGRLTESLGSGGCTNNPLIKSSSICSSSGSCSSVEMSGQVQGTGLGTSTLDACYTIIYGSSSSGVCYDGLGIGTLKAANGKIINISFGGNLCVADENPSTGTAYLAMNLTYVVEGGTGPFATETGTGNIATSNIFVLGGSGTIPGTGEISINGNLSKN